jgi:hypothetical protein
MENAYLKQKIANSSKEELIIIVYNFIINNLKNKNKVKSLEALSLLIDNLSWKNETEAKNFYNLYSTLTDVIIKENYDLAIKSFIDLKELWRDIIAFQKK